MTFDIRLKREKDFNLLFRKGKKISSNSMTILYLPKEQLKVGFIVSKKHGNSVNRNKIKRLLRESFRSFVPSFRQNFFFVIIPRVKSEYSLAQFKSDMNYCFTKGGFFFE